MNFRFYDPIFHIINSKIDAERKTVYHLKTQFSLKALDEKDKKRTIKKILGLIDDEKKLSHKQI